MNDTHENLNEGRNGGSPGMACSPSSDTPKSDELAAMLIHEDSILSFRKYIKRSLKLCRKLERKLAAARESEASETRWAAQYKAERDEVRDQLYRIAKEGFGLEDTIGGEACVDYVLRRLGKSPENDQAD